jgi:hypothetical protein
MTPAAPKPEDSALDHKRPDGWEWTHERQAKLIERDGWMCEQHPGLPFEHDPSCPGPGMPWTIEGRDYIEGLLDDAAHNEMFAGRNGEDAMRAAERGDVHWSAMLKAHRYVWNAAIREVLPRVLWSDDALYDAYAETLKGEPANRSVQSFEDGANWVVARIADRAPLEIQP